VSASTPPGVSALSGGTLEDRARSLLGVSDDAGFIEINAAWKQRLAEHHPDNGGDEQLAKMINRARDLLLEELEASKGR